jgi:hypothetical protein
MDTQHWKNTASGMARSFTVWFATAIAFLPELLPVIHSEFATFAPFIPAKFQPIVLKVVALGIVLLRLRTNSSLAEKNRETAVAKALKNADEESGV